MWLRKLMALVFPAVTLGLHQDTLELSVNYFKDRNVPFVCLVTCHNVMWDVKFTKAASIHSISVSSLNVDDLSHENMKQCFRQHFSVIGVLMNAQCANSEQIFYAASENTWLDAMHFWFIVDETEDLAKYQNVTMHPQYNGDSENHPRTLQILNNLNLSVDADVILALRNGDHFNIFDIFNFGKVQGGSLFITDVGMWSQKTMTKGLITGLNECKYYKRWDFGQFTLRMISVATSPSKNFDTKLLSEIRPVPGISSITRTSTMVFVVIAEVHNIKFSYTVTDRWLGSYDRNASRVVNSALYFREQDLTTVLRFQKPTLEKITLIHPALTSIETRYYYRIPTTGPGIFENQFLRPLSSGVWCCMLAISLLCAVILMFTARLETRPSAAQYALFSVTASICQQFFVDNTQTVRLSSARKLTIFITGVSCFLIYNYYTSSVVSWLLNGPPPSINSLQELLESPLELIYQDVGYTRSWLNTPGYYFNKRNAKSEENLRRKVLRKKMTKPILIPLEEGIAMVKAGGYAYHTETYSADTLISQTFDQTEVCELGSLPSMEKTLLYPGVQKNSPYKEFLTWSLTRLLERGIVSSIQRRTATHPASCDGSSPRALALGGAAPAFILLAMGFLLGTGIMFVERCIYKAKRSSW